MTFAPDSLKADRLWLIEKLDAHPGTNAHPSDLDPNEVGIVADSRHDGGYHCGRDRLRVDDYSAKTKRDKAGLSLAASALDIGVFAHEVGDKTYTQRHLAVWIVEQCQAGAPDAADIREVIYSPDGKVVLRYDRERGQKSTPRAGESDDSHLSHDHVSKYRDAEGRRLTPLFERWLREIEEGEDMQATEQLPVADWMKKRWKDDKGLQDGKIAVQTTLVSGYGHSRAGREAAEDTLAAVAGLTAMVKAMQAAITAITTGGTSIDTTVVVAAVEAVGAEVEEISGQLAAAKRENDELRAELAAAYATAA